MGEGVYVGQQTHFVRVGFCDGAGKNGWCAWCDTLYAVDPKYKINWEQLTVAEIMERLTALPRVPWVTISGGNPALHDLSALIEALHRAHYKVAVETQGTIWRDWFGELDLLTVSPKPPSAGSPDDERRITAMRRVRAASIVTPPLVCLKLAVDPFDPEDRAYVKAMYDWWCRESAQPVYLSCVTRPHDDRGLLLQRYRYMVDWVLGAAMPRAVPLLQMHFLLWGADRGH